MTDTATSLSGTPSVQLAADDPRAIFGKAAHTAWHTIAGVLPDELDGPTPCTDFTVRQLLGHLTQIPYQLAALANGDDPLAVLPFVAPGDEWVAAWDDAAEVGRAAWADDAVLTRMMTLPWASGPGGEMLLGYLGEITVHTWDLARATGQSPNWDEEVVRLACREIGGMPATNRHELFAQIRATMPEEFRNGPDPFADAVPVAEDAAPIDRLVAWNGRDPNWTPPAA